jgi:DNA replication regulator DPB11
MTSTSFSTMELLHASKMIALLGATYDQYLSPQIAVLVCGSNSVNKVKMAFARDKAIPSVNSSWLWACVDEASLVDVKKYALPQPEPGPASGGAPEPTATLKATSQDRQRYEDALPSFI